MRGRLAAACAAVLVGMSPAGALPFASFAAAASCQAADAGVQRASSAAVAGAEPAARRASHKPAVIRQAFAAATRAVWRSPSGPAPSRAPPA
jgi:hypothetical protein